MATDDVESGESGYYANVLGLRPPFLLRERLCSEEELHKLDTSENTISFSERPSIRKRIEDVKERIYGNIDKLDYLRGISSLEKNFTSLMEQVLHTALTLSKTNSVSHPQQVFDERMDEKVEQCWKYITQLTDAVQWHVMHASRYHKFHHEVQTARVELTKLLQTTKDLIDSLSASNKLDCDALHRVELTTQVQLDKLTKLASVARQLSIQARAVAPLHHRKHLPPGRHSANLLASMRLPQGAWLHRGDPVHVWANSQIASDLHNEWTAETLDGEQTATLPAPCLWLTSPEASPMSSTREHASRIKLYTGQYHSDEAKTEEDQQKKSSNSEWKSKSKLDLFSNNKILAEKFRTELFSAWTDIVGDIAVVLLPTYRAYLRRLVEINGDIPISSMDDLSDLKTGLQTLVDFGDFEMQSLLNELKKKPVSITSSDFAILPNELHQMVKTLNAWNILRAQLLESKRTASVRSLSQDAFNEASRVPQNKRIHSFDARRVSSLQETSPTQPVDAAPVHSTDYEISQMDELVTSFADPAPRTFRVLDNGNTQFIEMPQTATERIDRGTVVMPVKRTQSQPVSIRPNVETKDLMTQISTPFLPTIVHCPKCELQYEVDLYRSSTDLIQHSPGAEPMIFERGPEGPQLCSPRTLYLAHRTGHTNAQQSINIGKVRSADSMPVLPGSHEPKYLTGDGSLSSRSRTVEPAHKLRKRFGRLVKHRPHSFSTANTTPTTSVFNETTASSGIESLPDTPTRQDSKKKSKRGLMRKETGKHSTKHSGISIFRWGKKRRTTPESVSPGTDSLVTEPSLPGRRSPLTIDQPRPLHVQTHLECPDSNATLTDQDTPQPTLATPILRSRSWIQHGTPWGYGPPLHEQWRPSTEYVISQEHPQTQYMQSHSERLKIRTTRPHLSGERFYSTAESERSFLAYDSPVNQLMDSGIQTDTDLAPGLSNPGSSPKSNNEIDAICSSCQKRASHDPMIDSATQCGSAFSQTSQTGVNEDLERDCQKSIGCQIEIPTTKRQSVQLWDVSCQVGMIQKSQGIAVDNRDFKSEEFVPAVESSVNQTAALSQTKVSETLTLIDSSSYVKHSPLMFSVSCQIGQIIRDTACGPEHLEAVQLLDESIGKFEKQHIIEPEQMTISPVCKKIGKKLQVGKPWWEESSLRASLDRKDAAVSTSKELAAQLDTENIQGSQMKPMLGTVLVNDHVQTWISGDIIPCKRPVHDKSFQTHVGNVHAPENTHYPVKITFERASIQEAGQQKNEIKVSSLMCQASTSYVQTFPRVASVSTMIGYQNMARAQQTESLSESTYTKATKITNLADERHEDRSSVLPNPVSRLFQTAIPVDIGCETDVLEETNVHSRPKPCPTCGSAVKSFYPVSKRSKRIQKGSPKLSSNVMHETGEMNVSDLSDQSIGIGASSRKSRCSRRSYSHHVCEQPRVVVDVGFFGDCGVRPPSYNRRVQTRNNLHAGPEQSTSSSTASEVEDDMESVAQQNTIGHPRPGRCISMPANRVRMCFHLDQTVDANPHHASARRWAPYYQQRKRGANSTSSRAQKSWSVDDLRTIGQQSNRITLEETDTHHVCMAEPDRRGLQVGRCPGLERGASGARRRIDQLKQRHEQYQYY